ncbi:hypothetical protein Scep_009675 [Stephania cephalantha]|uniref:Uncharacterized protein n=1 Tax=Stephania cephalantha TaxID=152367 RepID=A0AAP0JUA5_9MAGN
MADIIQMLEELSQTQKTSINENAVYLQVVKLVKGNPAMASYSHNYGQFEDSRYYNVNGVGLQNLEALLIQVNITLQNMIDEKESCSIKLIFYPEESVRVNILKNVDVNEVTLVEDYWSERAEGLEVFQIEPEIIIELDKEVKNEMKIEVILERPEEPQKENKEDQPLVLVKPSTLPCMFVKPFKG